MSRHRYAATLTMVVFVLLSVPACSTGGRVAEQVTMAPTMTPTSTILFAPGGTPSVNSSTQDRVHSWLSVEATPWEITKTQNGEKTRVSAVRRAGNVTEYYTSSNGPNGSTGRRRVTSRSTNNSLGHRHSP